MPVAIRRWPYRNPPTGPFEVNRDSWQARGLVGWWPTVDRQHSGILRDRIDGFDATWQNSSLDPTASLQNVGGAAWFNNTVNSRYVVADDPKWDFTSELTVSMWMNVTTTGVRQVPFSHDLSDYKYAFYATNLDLFDWRVQTTSGIAGTSASGTGEFHNELLHITGVYDRANTPRVRLYKNGLLAYSNTGYDEDILAGDEGLEFGRGLAIRYFGGYLADIRVYGRVLSDQEIWQLYAPESRWDLYKPVISRSWHLPATGVGSAPSRLSYSKWGKNG